MSKVIAIGSGAPALQRVGGGYLDGPRGTVLRAEAQEEMNAAAFSAREAARWIARQARAPPYPGEDPAIVASFGATSADGRDGPSARDPPLAGRALIHDGTRYRWSWRGPSPPASMPPGAPSQPEAGRTSARDPPPGENEAANTPARFGELLKEAPEVQGETPSGRSLGWRDGYATGLRRCLVSLLSARGWSLSPDLKARIASAGPAALHELFHRALEAEEAERVFEPRITRESA